MLHSFPLHSRLLQSQYPIRASHNTKSFKIRFTFFILLGIALGMFNLFVFASEAPSNWKMITFNHLLQRMDEFSSFKTSDAIKANYSSLPTKQVNDVDFERLMPFIIAVEHQLENQTYLTESITEDVNPALHQTLAYLRQRRYGNSTILSENTLWTSVAGSLAPRTSSLLEQFSLDGHTSNTPSASTNPIQTIEELTNKTLWDADLLHLLVVFDVYISVDAPINNHPTGLILSFGGDLLSCLKDQEQKPNLIATSYSDYFNHHDYLADLHGTLLAGYYKQLPKYIQSTITLSQLLHDYKRYYLPHDKNNILQWNVALDAHFKGIDEFIHQIGNQCGLNDQGAHYLTGAYLKSFKLTEDRRLTESQAQFLKDSLKSIETKLYQNEH